MHVIRHEAERMQRTTALAAEREKVRQIDQAVFVLEEAIPPVVAAMADMDRHTRNDEARLSRHTAKTRPDACPLTPNRALTPIRT
jgi:hypothetical protein